MDSAIPLILQSACWLAALAWTGLAGWLASRPGDRMHTNLPGRWLLVMLAAVMALWSAEAAANSAASQPALAAVDLRNVVLLAWLFVVFHPRNGFERSRAVMLIFALLIALSVVSACISFAAYALAPADAGIPASANALSGELVMTLTASGGLLLVDQLVRAANERIRKPLLVFTGSIAALWAYDLNIFLIGAMAGRPALTLINLQPLVAALLIIPLVLASMDSGRERIRLSRTMSLRAAAMAGIATYLVLIAVLGAAVQMLGGDYGRLAQGVFLTLCLVVGGVLLLSDRLRAWAAVMVAKHFFEHRYDYRAEWIRFTETMGKSQAEEDRVERRVTRALAELVGSPAAVLMLPDEQGNLAACDAWRWPSARGGGETLSLRTAFMLQETGHIVDLDTVRRNGADSVGDLALPTWLVDDLPAWVVVPLPHFGRLIGCVILHRPLVARSLDWEDLDVLRIAGRQAASYLAEAQGQQALAEAQRFDEFNRRFAFIIHDVKNLASQLSLLATNADRHADNPAFRADMIATLKASVTRLNDMLARLAPHGRHGPLQKGMVDLDAVVAAEVQGASARHRVINGTATGLAVAGDTEAVRQIVAHLLSNAIDASPPEEPVQVIAAPDGSMVRIDVIDRGCGMTQQFIRDSLFKPFASSKDNGFGLGAYEVLKLTQAMGGRVEVESREGKGSRFSVWLPTAAQRRIDAPTPPDHNKDLAA